MSSSLDVLESSQNKTSQPRYSNDVNGMYSYSDLSNIHPYDVVKTSHSRYRDFGRLTRRLICDVRCHDHRSTNMRRLKLIACPLGGNIMLVFFVSTKHTNQHQVILHTTSESLHRVELPVNELFRIYLIVVVKYLDGLK